MKIQQIYVSITRDDGSTAIMGFITVGRGSYLPQGPDPAVWIDQANGWWSRPASDANIFAEISRTFSGPVPQPTNWRKINEQDIPKDRTFRNALTDDGTKLHHPMEKCHPLHVEKLRRLRQPLLDQLDRDWQKANAKNDKTEVDKIETERQRLRDITKDPRIETATTPEELKLITLD